MTATAEGTARHKWLLIVDDEPAICRIIERAAKQLGFSVRAVHDGEAFKAAYAETLPSAIVLDLNIPVSDGIELLRFLAQEGSKAQILVISGHGERVLEAARRLGDLRGLNMAGIINKPIRLPDLLAQLEQIREAA
jgi:CheY-like chemotaxis protein